MDGRRRVPRGVFRIARRSVAEAGVGIRGCSCGANPIRADAARGHTEFGGGCARRRLALRIHPGFEGAEAGRRGHQGEARGVLSGIIRPEQLPPVGRSRRVELPGSTYHAARERGVHMKIKDTLQRDPSTHPLVNQGQARIADRTTDREVRELMGELSTFVCEGEYAEGIQRIIGSFLPCRSQNSQKAAWVSGFFGSGKSHLLKMLCHLWQDTKFPDGSTARGLVPALPDEIRALLRELDTAGKRAGGLLAAAGALPGGNLEDVRLTVLSVLLRGTGFPEQYAQARFVLWLHERGFLDQVRGSVQKAGKEWAAELNDLYVSGRIAKAVLACDPQFAPNEAEARKSIREQFMQPTSDLTTAEFLSMVRQVLALKGKDGRFPCTALILDEVQQYIGSSPERSTLITEVAEALSKQLDSNLIVVGAGQSALSAQPLLNKLLDRFTIRVQLSDTDVETVTRKVLLQKKPTAVAKIQQMLDQHDGEVSRQLHDTQIGARAEDRNVAVDDYPLP